MTACIIPLPGGVGVGSINLKGGDFVSALKTGCYLLHSGVVRITVYTRRVNNCSKERVPVIMLFKVFFIIRHNTVAI